MAMPCATICSGRIRSILRPSKWISPDASGASPVIARSDVVLPAPLVPIKQTIWPCTSRSETCRSATLS